MHTNRIVLINGEEKPCSMFNGRWQCHSFYRKREKKMTDDKLTNFVLGNVQVHVQVYYIIL